MQTATADVEDVKQAETPEVVAEKEPQPAEEVKEAKPEKSAEQRRIDRLTRDKHQLRGELAAIRQQIESMRPQPQAEEGQVDIEELVERKLAEREAQNQYQKQSKQKDDVLAKAEALGDFDTEDFLESTPLSQALAEEILESPIGDKLCHYLYKNPEEAERLAELSPRRQLVELGKIEDKLKQKPALKKSAAPEPIKPISGKAPAEGLHDELSADDWMRERNKQIQNR